MRWTITPTLAISPVLTNFSRSSILGHLKSGTFLARELSIYMDIINKYCPDIEIKKATDNCILQIENMTNIMDIVYSIKEYVNRFP